MILVSFFTWYFQDTKRSIFACFEFSFNPLNTSPEYAQAGVYGKCVLKQNQIFFNG